MAGADYFLRAVELYDRKEQRNVDLAYREGRDERQDMVQDRSHQNMLAQQEQQQSNWDATNARANRTETRAIQQDNRQGEAHDAAMARIAAAEEQAAIIAGVFDSTQPGLTLIEQDDGGYSVNTTDEDGVVTPHTTSNGEKQVTVPKHMADSGQKIAMALDPAELQDFVTTRQGGLTLNQETGVLEFHDSNSVDGQAARATSAGLVQDPESGGWSLSDDSSAADLRIQEMYQGAVERGMEDVLLENFDLFQEQSGGATAETDSLRNTLENLIAANTVLDEPMLVAPEPTSPSIADFEGAPDIGVNSYAAPTPGSQMTVSAEEGRERRRGEDGYMPGRSGGVETFVTNPGETTSSGPTDAEGNPLPGRSTSTTTGRTEGASTTVTAEDTARLEQLNRDARGETTADDATTGDSKPKTTVTKKEAATTESLEEVAKSDITVTAKDEERIAETTAQNGRATYPEAQRRKIAALGIKAGNMNPQQAMNFIETGDMNKSTADVEAAGFKNAKAHNDFLKSELQLTELSQKIAANQDKQGADAQKDRIAMHKNLVSMANSLLTTRDEKTGKMNNKNPAQAEKAANGFIAAGERAGWDMDTVLGTTNGIEAFQNYTNAFQYFDGQPGATDVAFRASSKGMVPANREVATLTNEVYQKLASSGVEDVVGLQDQILGMTAGKSAEDQERILKNALASLPSTQ